MNVHEFFIFLCLSILFYFFCSFSHNYQDSNNNNNNKSHILCIVYCAYIVSSSVPQVKMRYTPGAGIFFEQQMFIFNYCLSILFFNSSSEHYFNFIEYALSYVSSILCVCCCYNFATVAGILWLPESRGVCVCAVVFI